MERKCQIWALYSVKFSHFAFQVWAVWSLQPRSLSNLITHTKRKIIHQRFVHELGYKTANATDRWQCAIQHPTSGGSRGLRPLSHALPFPPALSSPLSFTLFSSSPISHTPLSLPLHSCSSVPLIQLYLGGAL